MSVSSSDPLLDESFHENNEESFIEMEIFDILDKMRKDKPSLQRSDEINIAQEHCKEKLREDIDSQLKQKYLDKLVQLGLEKQTIEDEGVDVPVIRVRGHSLVLQSSRGRNPACELCLGTIWKIMHAWRRCQYCGLRVHEKCVSDVRRVCAAVIANRPDFVVRTKICEEKGLAAQNYRCVECSHPLAYDGAASLEPRLCDYTGLYFCTSCHWNDMMATPARLVHNLDVEPRPVARSTKQLLTLIDKRPLLALPTLNPGLFKLNSSLKRVHQIRRELLFMKCYFVSCRTARQLRILQYLCRHQHFVENAEMYSMAEMRELVNGRLLAELEEIHQLFRRHIEEECETCRGNGFICELCPDKEIIFPFSNGISMCPVCLAVYHQKCFAARHCPRCVRRRSRAPFLPE